MLNHLTQWSLGGKKNKNRLIHCVLHNNAKWVGIILDLTTIKLDVINGRSLNHEKSFIVEKNVIKFKFIKVRMLLYKRNQLLLVC